MLLPEPTYKGPESIVYFRGNNLQEEIQRDTKVQYNTIKFILHWLNNKIMLMVFFLAKMKKKIQKLYEPNASSELNKYIIKNYW